MLEFGPGLELGQVEREEGAGEGEEQAALGQEGRWSGDQPLLLVSSPGRRRISRHQRR